MQTQTQIEPLLYRVPELARALSISPSTCWSLIYAGKIKVVRIRTSVRIAHEEAERLVREGIAPERRTA